MANQNDQISVTRDRAKYRLPDEARDVLDLVNSIPASRRLPHQNEITGFLIGEPLPEKANLASWQRTMRDLLEGAPQWFLDRCLIIENAYRTLRGVRLSLRKMANIAVLPESMRHVYAEIPENKLSPAQLEEMQNKGAVFFGEESDEDIKASMAPGRVLAFPGYWVTMNIDSDGRMAFREDFSGVFLRSFAGVIADRLRICQNPNCRRLFYADRQTKVACDPVKCGPLVRQRRRRESLKTAREMKRRKSRK